MAVFKPFCAFRPTQDKAKLVASRPYDVLNSDEARIEAQGNKFSFLRVIKPEIDLPEETYLYSEEVYDKGAEVYNQFKKDGVLIIHRHRKDKIIISEKIKILINYKSLSLLQKIITELEQRVQTLEKKVG